MHQKGGAADYSELFAALTTQELAALQGLPWQGAPQPGEAVSARFSPETGVQWIGGAMPFLETPKGAVAPGENLVSLRSEVLAGFLLQNHAFFRSYIHAARAQRQTLVGDYSPAYLAQVSSDLPGMEAANFAIFLAAAIGQESGEKTLLVDADPENQFVFPLLTFKEEPKVLTENLQKPSTFRADLLKTIVPLNKNLSYLNLQAPSLRPFEDTEISHTINHLDAEFDNIVVYSGQMKSPWLTRNAHVNYAICADNYRGEQSAILRHRAGFHTVLVKKTKENYLPGLTRDFSDRQPLEAWLEKKVTTSVLREFILKVYRAKRLVIGGKENLPGHLHCLTGFDLYAWYEGLERNAAERSLNVLQKKLRAYYPKSAFFSGRSVLKRVKNLPERSATTILEIGSEPQMVSLMGAAELRAAAIFPAGILPAILADGVRISACTAHGFTRFRAIAARGGFDRVLTAPRYRLEHPDALAAVMEQVQA